VPARTSRRFNLQEVRMKTPRSLASVAVLVLAASGCTSPGVVQERFVERMYVINCGVTHAKDVSPWTTPADSAKPYVFSNHCYLVRHAKGLMLWDSGFPDRFASLPNGQANPRGTTIGYLKKPLLESLKEIGVAPADIGHFAMSHSHGDHSGNAGLFAASTIYMQTAEYDVVFGPEPQRFNFISAYFDKLRGARIVKLNGDHDVFGDGSVVIKSTPGHTQGHQALFVRLRQSGPVLLSGDFVHFRSNWEAKRSPSINYNADQTLRSMNEMDAFIKATGARLWINHDSEQSATIPKSPAFAE
jgi:glyoxylase-like metal-dependent hydrolase (beta-lactamase superfamily II)